MKPKLEEAISVVATGHTQTTIKYQKVTARRDCHQRHWLAKCPPGAPVESGLWASWGSL